MAEIPTSNINGKILNPAEHDACVEIVSMDILPYSKRAKALLLLNKGVTQKNASAETGLSLGQVRYALSLYKENGMEMFAGINKQEKPEEPKNLTPQEPVPVQVVSSEPEPELVAEPIVKKSSSSKKDKKKKKKMKTKKERKLMKKAKKGKATKEKKVDKNKIAKKARKKAKKEKEKK